MIPTAAIYSRFSTALQSEKSTADQIALCKDYAAAQRWRVVASYADEAKSGASTIGRDGFNAMLADAMAGKFSIILVEALDRLSRDMADMAGMFKRLEFMGIRLVEVHGGEANALTVGIKAIVAQQYLADLKPKIRRGMAGLIRDGKSAGGKAYGYTANPASAGHPMIVEHEAEIVHRIFREYHAGTSPRAICHALNREGVPPPRGKLWQASALYGFASRGTGMLRNPIYAGRIVWNKVHMVKDPDTGKRLSRPNPESQWQTAEAPELAIIPADLFDAVQAQLKARSTADTGKNAATQRRPQYLLSGLLKCGACGSGMVRAGRDKSGRERLRCSAHVNSRSCPDPVTFYAEDVERLVIDCLTKELATTEQVERYAKAWLEGRHKQAAQFAARRIQLEKALAATLKKLDKATRLLLTTDGDEAALMAAQRELGAERDRIHEELQAEPPASNIIVLPSAVAAFAERLKASRAKLEYALHLLDASGELHRLVRDVVQSVTIARDERKRLIIYVRTWLDPFTGQGGVNSGREEGLKLFH